MARDAKQPLGASYLAALGCAAVGSLGGAGCSSDLFHSTVWTSRCDAESTWVGCPDAAETSADAAASGAGGASASSTASSTSSAGEGGAGGVTSGATGGTGTTGDIGCADGQREGFLSIADAPNVAACAGSWSVPGLLHGGPAPTCGLGGGDDVIAPNALDCAAADLCAVGWHVCSSSVDFAAHSGTGCDKVSGGFGTSFFASGQSTSGDACTADGADDFVGCGDIGDPVDTGCAPFDRLSGDLCKALTPEWSCGSDGTSEALNVTKTGPDNGGVLCCRDPAMGP